MNSTAPISTLFALSSAGARQVHLALFFATGWRMLALSDEAECDGRREKWVSMVKALVPLAEVSPGRWECAVPLALGRHEYLFLVDGEWVIDPSARELCSDGDGNQNCVRAVENIATSEITRSMSHTRTARMRIANLRKRAAA